MTPSLFVPLNDDRIVDEYTFGQYQDYETAHAALVNHWDTWITLSDFQAIKDAGSVTFSMLQFCPVTKDIIV
jgi:glucan 1,3-beta-glucosidase